MPVIKTIQWRALLLLIIFTANFSIICHCSAHAGPSAHAAVASQPSCCGHDRQEAAKGMHSPSHHPCDDKSGCPATHALKFNLLEKQVPSPVYPAPLFAILITTHLIIVPEALKTRSKDCPYLHKHSPPDLQALYQRFLI